MEKSQPAEVRESGAKHVDIMIDSCDDIEDDSSKQDKIRDEDITAVRECAFSANSDRLCMEYKRLVMRHNGFSLFKKLITSCKIIMKWDTCDADWKFRISHGIK